MDDVATFNMIALWSSLNVLDISDAGKGLSIVACRGLFTRNVGALI
jgi:hypothetical protein